MRLESVSTMDLIVYLREMQVDINEALHDHILCFKSVDSAALVT